MKRRITISITFALVVLATIAAFHSMGRGQGANTMRRHTAHSGLIRLNQNQFVRLTLANATPNPNAGDRLTARMNVHIAQYAPSGQQGSVMNNAVVGQNSTGPITLRPGEGASIDFDLTQAVRPDVEGVSIIVEGLPLANSNDRAAATASLTIYDKLTNQPLSIWIWTDDEDYIWM